MKEGIKFFFCALAATALLGVLVGIGIVTTLVSTAVSFVFSGILGVIVLAIVFYAITEMAEERRRMEKEAKKEDG